MNLFSQLKRWTLLTLVARVKPPAPFVQAVCDELTDPEGAFFLAGVTFDHVLLKLRNSTRRQALFDAGVALQVHIEGENTVLCTHFFDEVPLSLVEQELLEQAIDAWSDWQAN